MHKLLRAASGALFVTIALTGGCKKKDAEPTPAVATGSGSATGSATGSAAGSGSAVAAPSEAEKVAKAIEKAIADAATEKARFTPEMETQIEALRDGTYADAKAALTAILASPHREAGNKDRDAARHPIETLTLFGITPASTVIEVGAGGGWYTELLAPLVAAKGKLVAAGPDANGPADKMSTVFGKRLDFDLAKSPALYGKVQRATIAGDTFELAPAGTADLALAIREMHNWVRRKELPRNLAAIHAALKDGGTFGVVAHRAKPDAKAEDSAGKGYLPEAWVIEQVTAAGFELVEKAEINANPKDTKDYEKGVWTLPPNFAEGDKDKATYTEIGESDRMTLKFKKVAKK